MNQIATDPLRASSSGASPETSPATANASSALAEFIWQLVRQPAHLTAGSRLLQPQHRIIAERLMQRSCELASRVIHRPVEGRWRAEVASVGAAFGIELTIGNNSTCVIAIDLAAARALVEPLTVEIGGLRGTGGLTDTERGLLEYLAVEVIDQLAGDMTAASAWQIRRFLRANEIPDRVAAIGSGPVLLTLHAGGQAGTAALWVKPLPTTAPAFPSSGQPIDGPTVPLQISLRPLVISDTDIQSLRPGDTIATGITEFTSTPCEIVVVATSWAITTGVLNRWTPGGFHVGARHLTPAPLHDRPGTVRPVLGTSQMTKAHFLSIFGSGSDAGFGLDFAAEIDHPVTLYYAGKVLADAEIVAVDGELGFRLLSRSGEAGDGGHAP